MGYQFLTLVNGPRAHLAKCHSKIDTVIFPAVSLFTKYGLV